jgi:Zn-dependent M28 family amino/carboxypeptidase
VAGTDPAPGASDNGSGTAIVLEMAEILSTMHAADPVPRDVIFLLFDGEEDGLLGSFDWVADFSDAAGTLLCVVNFDMVGWDPEATPGRYWYSYMPADEPVAAFGLEAIGEFVPEATVIPSTLELMAGSDHAPFWDAGYCALSLTSYPPPNLYHTTADIASNYDWDFYMGVARSSAALVAALAWRWAD